VEDPVVRAFWQTEFEGYSREFVNEAVAPILNKVGQLLMSPPVRNILGQVRSRFDPRFMMDNRRIFIANLSKGRLGEDKANLLGALLVTRFQLAAMSRVEVREQERADFFLFIDEFHSFSTDSFAGILSEARKYRLTLTLANQYMQQLRDEVRSAVLGNVGTVLAFRVGSEDAFLLEREFGEGYPANRFTELANHQVLVKLLKHGEYGEPFVGETLPAQGGRWCRGERILVRSRERYAARRTEIEDKIAKWMG
jgi:tRNA isopentenyl-2-thiomethyl-A-37 hydroxylase MiaE